MSTQPDLEIDILSIFPQLFDNFLAASFVGMARERGLARIEAHDLRRWTTDRHRTVDDSPYGGGPGMLLKPEPLVEGIEALATLADGRLLALTEGLTAGDRLMRGWVSAGRDWRRLGYRPHPHADRSLRRPP